MHNPHLRFLKAAENIAQLYRDDRKKNICCTSGGDHLKNMWFLWATQSWNPWLNCKIKMTAKFEIVIQSAIWNHLVE